MFDVAQLTFRMTGWPPRSLSPSITSSLASTVPNAGHQLTGTSACSAKNEIT